QGTRGSLRRGRPCIHPDPPAARSVAHTPPTPPPHPGGPSTKKTPGDEGPDGATGRGTEKSGMVGAGGTGIFLSPHRSVAS
ncbi:hypothetical protein DC025_14410, partial [Enterococcus faecalis]